MAKPTPTSPPSPPSGAPRWTYVLGALVGALTLGWAVVSAFIPKPAPSPQAAPGATAPGSTTTVMVSGQGAVGVGQMSGGQIQVGAVPASAAASR